ncbi:MAG: DnaB-like helicase C-terminal domain-containing protein, partial [Spirochaetia bacterium]|nr:DnaB-like helicase C-terminal domain-containing protein [Spirochaetia bacterium]
KQLARELDIPIIGLTQLNRSSEARPGAEREPRLSDIRESGALEQDADIVLFIHRNTGGEEAAETQNLVDIIVAKNRHGERGKLQLFFNAAYTRFENYARGEAE